MAQSKLVGFFFSCVASNKLHVRVKVEVSVAIFKGITLVDYPQHQR